MNVAEMVAAPVYCPDCGSPVQFKPECICGWKSHEVPLGRPGTVCNKHNKPSVLNLLVVKKMDGVERKGPFFQFGHYDRRKGGKAKLYLKPGFIFVRWDLECEKCQTEIARDTPAPLGPCLPPQSAR